MITQEDFETDAIDSMFCTLLSVRAAGYADFEVLSSFLANLMLMHERPKGALQALHNAVETKMHQMMH